MVKNPLVNAGHVGSIPGLEEFYMRGATKPVCLALGSGACTPQLLCPRTLEPVHHSKRAHHNEKPSDCNWRVAATCCK